MSIVIIAAATLAVLTLLSDIKSINRRGRHTVVTFMNNAELDDKTIESQLGHYDVRFTRQRYMNAQDKQIRREMDKLVTYLTAF